MALNRIIDLCGLRVSFNSFVARRHPTFAQFDLLRDMVSPAGERIDNNSMYLCSLRLGFLSVDRALMDVTPRIVAHMVNLDVNDPDIDWGAQPSIVHSLDCCEQLAKIGNDFRAEYLRDMTVVIQGGNGDQKWCCTTQSTRCFRQACLDSGVPFMAIVWHNDVMSAPVLVEVMMDMFSYHLSHRMVETSIARVVLCNTRRNILDSSKTCDVFDLPRHFTISDCAVIYSSMSPDISMIQGDSCTQTDTPIGSFTKLFKAREKIIMPSDARTPLSKLLMSKEQNDLTTEALEALSSASTSVEDFVETAAPRVEEILDGLNRTTAAMEKVFSPDFVENAFEFFHAKIMRTMDNVFSHDVLINAWENIVSLVTDVLSDSYPFSISGVSRFIYRVLVTFGIHTSIASVFHKLYSSVLSLFVTDSTSYVRLGESDYEKAEAVPQGALPTSGLTLISALVGTILLGVVPTRAAAKDVAEYLRTFNLCVPAFRHVNDILQWVVSFLPEVIQAWLCSSSDEERWIYEVRDGGKFKLWHDRLTLACEDENFSRLHYDTVLQKEILDLDEEGKQLLVKSALFDGNPSTTKLHNLTFNHLRKLSKFVAAVKAARIEHTDRLCPFSVYLSGSPGVGKTTLSTSIAKALSLPSYPEHCVYDRPSDCSPFWDGYHGQPIIRFDDFFQNPESNDVSEYICLNSSAPYRLNMASVDDPVVGIKGQTSRAELIIVCSNTAYPVGPNTSAVALLRRRHVLIDVVLKNSCSMKDYQPDFSHLMFRILDPLVPGSPPIRVLHTFSDLIRYLITEQCRHIAQEKKARVANVLSMTCASEIRREIMGEENVTFNAVVQGNTESSDEEGLVNENACTFSCLPRNDETVGAEDTAFDVFRKKMNNSSFKKQIEGKKERIAAEWREVVSPIVEAVNRYRAANPRGVLALKLAAVAAGLAVPIGLLFKFFRQRNSVGGVSPLDDVESRLVSDLRLGINKLSDGDKTSFKNLLLKCSTCSASLFDLGVEGNFLASGDERTARLKRHQRGVRMKAEGSTDSVAATLVMTKIVPQLVVCSIDYSYIDPEGQPDRHRCNLNALFIKGNVMLAPYHFFLGPDAKLFPAGTIITLSYNNGTVLRVAFNPSCLVRLVGASGAPKDVVIYATGSRVPSVSDITKHFVQSDSLSSYEQFMGELVVALPGHEHTRMMTRDITQLSRPKQYRTTGPISTQTFKLVDGFQYNLSTSVGFCGAPLVVHDSHLLRKIVGVHVCGSVGVDYGQAELVTHDQIINALNSLPVQIQGCDEYPKFEPLDSALLVPDGNLSFIGVLGTGNYPRAPVETEIRPSILFDTIEVHVTEPAVLSPSDRRLTIPVSPLLKGAQKYGVDTIPMKPDILQIALAHTRDTIMKWSRPKTSRILTEHEAINGIPGEEYFDALNMESSPGLPYTLTRKKGVKGKRYLFNGEPGSYVIHDLELRKNLDHIRDVGRHGIRPYSVWTGQLKDERRSLEKVASGSTRMFVYPPVHHTIRVRELMLSFCACFYNNRLNSFSAVGIDPESLEWHRLAGLLLSTSDIGFAGDFSNYDGSLMPEVMSGIMDIINEWYGFDDFNLERNAIADEWIHTLITCMNLVYMKHTGNPSGCPLTVVINTIANYVYMLYAWLQLAPPELRDGVFFDSHVKMFAYGDDNILAVRPSCIPFFNMQTVSDVLRGFGQKYTSPSKDEAHYESQPVLDFTFLKRKFAHVDHSSKLTVAQLDQNSILEMINWVRKSDDPVGALRANVNTAMRFAFFYGSSWYNRLRSKIMNALREKRIPIVIPSYQYYNAYFGANFCLPVLVTCDMGYLGVEIPETTQIQADSFQHERPEMTGVRSINIDDTLGISDLSQGRNVVGASVATSVADPIKSHLLPDPAWTMSNILGRKTMVATGIWDASMARHHTLWAAVAPWDVIIKTSNNHVAFNMFNFWRGKVRIEVRVNGTSFHVGRLILYYAPMTNFNTALRWHGNNTCAQTSVPYVMIDPALNTPAVLEIPFINPKNAINLENPGVTDFLGTIGLDVFSQLATGAVTTPAVGWTVLVSFHELDSQGQFSIPGKLGTIGVPYNYSAITAGSSFAPGLSLKDKHKEDEEFGVIQGNTTSYTNNFRGVERAVVGDQKNTSEDFSGAAAGSTQHLSCLDKPNIALSPLPVFRSPVGYFSNAVNFDYLEALALHPPESKSDKHTFSTGVDEMSLPYLCSIMNPLQIFTWDQTSAVNTILATNFLCPCAGGLKGDWPKTTINVAPTLNTVEVLSIDYFSAKFSFWSGSLRYRVAVIASGYHSGRLFMGFHYGQYQSAATLEDATSQYGVYIDLNDGQHEFDIVVPFEAASPLRVPCGPVGNTSENLKYAMGNWSIRVVNPLQVVPGVSNSVNVWVWQGAGPDYKLYNLGVNNAGMIPVAPTLVSEVPATPTVVKEEHVDRDPVVIPIDEEFTIIQSDTQVGRENETMGSAMMSKSFDSNRYQDHVVNIRDALHRYGRAFFIDPEYAAFNPGYLYGQAWIDVGMLLFYPPSVNYYRAAAVLNFNLYPGANNLIRFFGSAFGGWRGNLRFKILHMPDTRQQPFESGYNAPYRMYASFIPHTTISSLPDNYNGTSDQLRVAGTMAPKPFNGGLDPVNDCEAFFGMTQAPMSIADPFAGNYNMVDVPFSSIYDFAMIPHTSVHDNKIIGTEACSPGTLILAAVHPTFSAARPRIDVFSEGYVSVGDSFRFGIYLGPPNVIFISNLYPDTYE